MRRLQASGRETARMHPAIITGSRARAEPTRADPTQRSAWVQVTCAAVWPVIDGGRATAVSVGAAGSVAAASGAAVSAGAGVSAVGGAVASPPTALPYPAHVDPRTSTGWVAPSAANSTSAASVTGCTRAPPSPYTVGYCTNTMSE